MTTTTVTAAGSAEDDDGWDLVILSDSFSQASWPERWAELIERDQGVSVRVHNHVQPGEADYLAMLEDPGIRSDLVNAEVILISPDPDVLRRECPPDQADEDCRERVIEEYRDTWRSVLEQILVLNDESGTTLRSVKAWAWTVPLEMRQGLDAFMTACADESEERGFGVADVNVLTVGSDLEGDTPDNWLRDGIHFSDAGSEAVAKLLHSLGYESSL